MQLERKVSNSILNTKQTDIEINEQHFNKQSTNTSIISLNYHDMVKKQNNGNSCRNSDNNPQCCFYLFLLRSNKFRVNDKD